MSQAAFCVGCGFAFARLVTTAGAAPVAAAPVAAAPEPAPEPATVAVANEPALAPAPAVEPAPVPEPIAPEPAPPAPKPLVPPIPADLAYIDLIASSQLRPYGPGGDAFASAIAAANAQRIDDARRQFEAAIAAGVDPLREGYAHASAGEIALKQGDLDGAVSHLLAAFDRRPVLYEAAHGAAGYLGVILETLGRSGEAATMSSIASRTSSFLGYSLSPVAADRTRALVIAKRG